MLLDGYLAAAVFILVVVEGSVATSLREIADVPVCDHDLVTGA